MKGLTTHVLDTIAGTGAAGMRVEVQGPEGVTGFAVLDGNGRATLLAELHPGAYEISFFAGDYLGFTEFYDVIPVAFLVKDPQKHHHVPLVLSAYGYATYRGG